MVVSDLINVLKTFDGDLGVYINIGNGDLPIESASVEYINSETGVVVLKTYNS